MQFLASLVTLESGQAVKILTKNITQPEHDVAVSKIMSLDKAWLGRDLPDEVFSTEDDDEPSEQPDNSSDTQCVS
jgi:hypothetical protein